MGNRWESRARGAKARRIADAIVASEGGAVRAYRLILRLGRKAEQWIADRAEEQRELPPSAATCEAVTRMIRSASIRETTDPFEGI